MLNVSGDTVSVSDGTDSVGVLFSVVISWRNGDSFSQSVVSEAAAKAGKFCKMNTAGQKGSSKSFFQFLRGHATSFLLKNSLMDQDTKQCLPML